MGKKAVLAILTFVLFALATVATVAIAQTTVPAPSVPDFTVKIGDLKAIELTIKNQPFVPYYDNTSGSNIYIAFYYNVQAKMHNDENWTDLYQIEDVPTQSGSGYTTLLYSFYAGDNYILGGAFWELPSGSQVDFQVEAMIGYFQGVVPLPVGPWHFNGETSGWSNTQTLTIPNASPSPSPTQQPTFPTLPPLPPLNDNTPAPTSSIVSVSISSSLTNPTIYLGQQVLFYASVHGGINSYNFQWYANSSPIAGETSAGFIFSPTSLGQTNIYATIQDAFYPNVTATSNTVSVTVNSPTPSPSPTQQPTLAPSSTVIVPIAPAPPIWNIVVVFAVLIAVTMVVTVSLIYLRKRRG